MCSIKTTGDQLTIVNRSTEHRVSKELIRKIPYFEKLLSHDLKETKENKIELDFDEKAFKLILNWVKFGFLFIEMDNVINLCTIADYFGINNYLIDDCISHFHDNFSIEHLPVVIPQVTATSKLINSDTLNAFICRYFTKIVNTTVWLGYPIETVKYICALNLFVYSELKVFDAIMKWVNFKADTRNGHLKGLLKLIRWCHFKSLCKIKRKEILKELNSLDFNPKICSHCTCTLARTKQTYFIAIEQLNATDLQVKVLDRNFVPLVNHVFQSDKSMPLHVLHDEYVSDISFDSGRRMIRIDWKQSKYRLLNRSAYKLYYHKIHKCLFGNQKSGTHAMEQLYKCYGMNPPASSLLEACDKFILVRCHEHFFEYWITPTAENIDSHLVDSGNRYLSTILDNNMYMIKNNLELFQVTVDSKVEFKKMEIDRLKDFNFDNLLLTSNLANDELIIIEKSTKALFSYNVKTEEWSSMGRISSCDSKSADGQRESHKLIIFTSTFLPIDFV